MIALSFWALTLLCCGLAARFGGRDGRRVALVFIIGCLATVLASLVDQDWRHTALATFGVDVTLLVAFWWIALESDRWFPLWIAGFHLVTVASHLASLFAPGFLLELYFVLQGFWAVPMLLVLAAGTMLDWRRGLIDEPLSRESCRDS